MFSLNQFPFCSFLFLLPEEETKIQQSSKPPFTPFDQTNLQQLNTTTTTSNFLDDNNTDTVITGLTTANNQSADEIGSMVEHKDIISDNVTRHQEIVFNEETIVTKQFQLLEQEQEETIMVSNDI